MMIFLKPDEQGVRVYQQIESMFLTVKGLYEHSYGKAFTDPDNDARNWGRTIVFNT